jgi:Flp pilus assembly protein TadD
MKDTGQLLAAAALAALVGGCASFEAMRLYESGTQALDRGDPQRAVADLERAAALAPDASPIENHLGLAYQDAGRPEDALHAFERAVQLDCDNQAAAANLRAMRSHQDP